MDDDVSLFNEFLSTQIFVFWIIDCGTKNGQYFVFLWDRETLVDHACLAKVVNFYLDRAARWWGENIRCGWQMAETGS